jgi:hypothetical protein
MGLSFERDYPGYEFTNLMTHDLANVILGRHVRANVGDVLCDSSKALFNQIGETRELAIDRRWLLGHRSSVYHKNQAQGIEARRAETAPAERSFRKRATSFLMLIGTAGSARESPVAAGDAPTIMRERISYSCAPQTDRH